MTIATGQRQHLEAFLEMLAAERASSAVRSSEPSTTTITSTDLPAISRGIPFTTAPTVGSSL